MATKTQVMNLCNKLGIDVGIHKYGNEGVVMFNLPVGKVLETGDHSVGYEWEVCRSTMAQIWDVSYQDLINGITDCSVTDCDTCAANKEGI